MQKEREKKLKIHKYIFSGQLPFSMKNKPIGSIRVKPCRPG